jgi:hypothetical protein
MKIFASNGWRFINRIVLQPNYLSFQLSYCFVLEVRSSFWVDVFWADG